MKKLLFATAVAASVAAFADGIINAISFEGYSADDSVLGVGVAEGSNTDTVRYFCFEGTATDDSKVKAFGGTGDDAVAAPATRPIAYGAEFDTNANFLQISTEGGILWRSLAAVNETTVEEVTTYSLGAAQQVNDGIYLDTMVQFTPTEDDEPTLGAGDKLAIWLGVVTNTAGEVTDTNLMVKAGYYDAASAFVTKTFSLDNEVKEVVAGQWYRLTIVALDDVFTANEEVKVPAFIIKIDGVEVQATEATIHSTAVLESFAEILTADRKAQLAAGKIFLSVGEGEAGVPTTLQGVGFQGTGAIDDLVLTRDDPFAGVEPTVVDFVLTLTTDSNVASVAITTNGAAVVFDNGTALIPSNTVVTVGQPTFAAGYEIGAFTVGGTSIASPVFPYDITIEAATTVGITSKQTPVVYPSYIDTTDATIKGKYDAWKSGVGCDDSTASQYLNQFLLNVDEATTVGDAALKITEIKVNETAGWDITIGCTVENVSLTGTVGESIVCNGYLAVSYTSDLTGTWTTENIPVTAVDATTGTVTVNVNKTGAKFMKVTLTAAPATTTPAVDPVEP